MHARNLKFCRNLIAMLLAVCMIAGMLPVSVFAAEGETVKYVSLGDSMSNGFGMDGYEYEYHVGDASMTECEDANCTQEHAVFHWSNGFLQETPGIYPVRVAEHYGWELSQMAMSGMRIEDLHWALEADYNNASAMATVRGAWNQDAWNAAFTNGDYYTWESIANGRFPWVYPGASLETTIRLYQENVADADVVSLACGNANFGVFLAGLIQNEIGFGGTSELNSWVEVENSLRALDDTTRGYAMQAYNMLNDKIAESGMPQELASAVLKVTAYTMFSFLINYRGALDAIITLNPDVELVLVGIMDNMYGMKLEAMGQIFDIGDYVQIAIDAVNNYMAGIAAAMQMSGVYPNATIYFMEANNVDILYKEFPVEIETSKTIRARFVSDIVGTEAAPGLFWSVLTPVVGNIVEGAEMQYITLEDIERYETFDEKEQVAYAGGYMEGVTCGRNMAMSIELYLGVEDALLDACELDVYNVDNFLSIGDMQGSGIFQPVIDNYSANIGPNSNANFDRAIAAIAAYANVSTDIIEMAYEMGDYFDAIFGNVLGGLSITNAVDSMCMLYALRDTLCNALEFDNSIFGLLGMYSRNILGNAMASHPSLKGHETLYNSFVSSYGSYTAENLVMDTISHLVDLLLEYAPEALDEFYQYADEEGYSNSEYCVREDSLYVALGDASGMVKRGQKSYIDTVAESLEIDFRNLSGKGNILDAYNIIEENTDLIAQADLITLGYGNNVFVRAAVERLSNGISGLDMGEYDWSVYVGEDKVSYVEDALAEIEAMLSENGMGDPNPAFSGNSLALMMTKAVEAFVYEAVTYACNFPEVVNAIRAINEDAVVIGVGMNNPFRGTVLSMEEMEFAIEDYVDYLVEAANIHGLIYAVNTGNCIYVDAPDAETDTNNVESGAINFMIGYMTERLYTGNPTAEGHAYIAQQILNALTLVCDHQWSDWTVVKEPTCTEEGSQVRTCAVCAQEEFEAIPVSAHNFKDGVCENCGATQSDLYRLKGSNRYRTGTAIANELKAVLGIEKFQTVIVAYGEKFPDALTGSYLAGKFDAPILLTDKSADAEVAEYIRSNVAEGGKVYILGGTAAVTQSFEDNIRSSGYDVERLKGKNRYETNLEILKEAGVDASTEILIATGSNYADSLSASATGLPMLLVDKELTAQQVEFLEGTSKRFVILGGTAAVSEAVEEALDTIGEVTRVKGKNRYETSTVIAQRYFSAPNCVVLAYGEAFPDGLCGGPLALVAGAPLILANNNNLSAADAFVEGIRYGYVTGGTGRLTDATVREIFDADPNCVVVVK